MPNFGRIWPLLPGEVPETPLKVKGVTSEVLLGGQALRVIQKREQNDPNIERFFAEDTCEVTQTEKDTAFLILYLGFPIGPDYQHNEEKRLRALAWYPVGSIISPCHGCSGIGTIEVENFDDPCDMGGYAAKTVDCPICKGEGWHERK